MGSPLLNLIRGIGIGVGAASVNTRLWYVPEARVKLRCRLWKMIWVPLQNHLQFPRRNWIGANRIFMLYLHFRRVWWRNMVRMMINLSVRDELNSLILRTRRGFEVCVWVPKAVLSCMLVRNTCRMFFFKNWKLPFQPHNDWTSEIRGTETRLFLFIYVTNPNSTLTSSASTNIRRSLQSLPFPPSDDRLLCALLASCRNLDVISVSLSPNEKGREKEKEKEKEKRGHSAERRRKVDHWVGASYLDTGWGDELLYEMWSKFWLASTETLVVYVDGVFVRLALDGLVPLIIHFWFDLISVSFPLIIFYCRHVSFRILIPIKIHHVRLQLNPQELVMHPMILYFGSFTLSNWRSCYGYQ